MSAYISGLVQASEREAAALANQKASQADDARERLIPLQDRLGRLLATIPPSVLEEGFPCPLCK